MKQMYEEELSKLLKTNTGISWYEGEFIRREKCLKLLEEAFNLGVQAAADNVKLLQVAETDFSIINRPKQIKKTPYIGMYSREREGDTEYWVEVDRESILKLKIE